MNTKMNSENSTQEEDFALNFFNQIIDLWILPEVKDRQNRRVLESPFALKRAQIIFKHGEVPQVRLNEEVRTGEVQLELQKAMSFEPGDIVYINDVKGIKKIELIDSEANFGHITLIEFGENWTIYFDARYNKKIAQQYIEIAKQFVDTAEFSLGKGYVAPFYDNLFSAFELAVKAILLMIIKPQLKRNEKHRSIKRGFRELVELGIMKDQKKDVFQTLIGLRNSHKYVYEKKVTDERQEEEDWITLVRKVIAQIQGLVE